MNTIRTAKLFMVSIIFFVSFSCNNGDKDIEKVFLTDAIVTNKTDKTIKCIIILTDLGCNSCIQEGEAFIKEQISKVGLVFILTNISILKILEQKIRVNINDHLNVFIENTNVFYLPTGNCIYPCLIYMKGDKILRHEFQSPENHLAFNNLRNQMIKM